MRVQLLFGGREAGPLAELAQRVGAQYGWLVVVASDLEEAGLLLREHRWDAVVGSADDPEIDGPAVLARTRELQPAATRLLVSEASEPDAQQAEVAHRILDTTPTPAVLRAVLTVISATALTLPSRLRDVVGDVASLPVVADLLTEVATIVADPDAGAEDVVPIIGGDPALAAKVLHLANAGFVRSQGQVTDLRQAAALLGMEVLHQVVMASAAFSAAGAIGADDELVRIAQRHGAAASRAASATEDVPGYAVSGALLIDIGLPLMDMAWPDEHRRLRAASLAGEASLHVLERVELGVSHAEAGTLLARRWSLPEPVFPMIAGHHFQPMSPTRDETALGYVVHRAAQRGAEEGRDPYDLDVPEKLPAWVDQWVIPQPLAALP